MIKSFAQQTTMAPPPSIMPGLAAATGGNSNSHNNGHNNSHTGGSGNGGPPTGAGNAHASTSSRIVLAAETAWIQIAANAQLMGDYERAQVALEMILRHNPYHAGAYVRIGHLLHNQQQYMQAAESYQKAISLLDGGAGGASLPATWAALAHCWLLLDDLPRAFSAYQQALGYPGGARDSSLWFGVGLLYDRYGADEHALEAFSAALKLEEYLPVRGEAESRVPPPMIREIFYRVGSLLRNRRRYEGSLQCFEFGLHFPPAPLQRGDVKLQMAITHELQGEREKALSLLQSLGGDGRRAVGSRARCLLGWYTVKGAVAGAAAGAAVASAAVADDSADAGGTADADANANINVNTNANANANFEEIDKGIATLKTVVSDDLSDAMAWYFLGRAQFLRRSYSFAYEAYQEAVYRDGQNAAFWNSIGILYAEIKQYRDALDAFSRAIHQNPAIAEVWWNLGLLYETCNNQSTDAIDAYQRAAEISPQDAAIAGRLAMLRAGAPAGTMSPPQLSLQIRELDPFPYVTRSILLGAAHIPPQKSTSAGQPRPPLGGSMNLVGGAATASGTRRTPIPGMGAAGGPGPVIAPNPGQYPSAGMRPMMRPVGLMHPSAPPGTGRPSRPQ